MKESFVQYVWKYQKFSKKSLTTTQGQRLEIIKPGGHNQSSGPDFFNALLNIEDQLWAGNVEIHVNSSDWYLHHHEKDPAYNNVILHVVWEHDSDVFRSDQSVIPVLELKRHVEENLLENYQKLIIPKKWIFCESMISDIPEIIMKSWMESLFFERLEQKTIPIRTELDRTRNDWEATLFIILAKGFGLNINGDAFYKLAQTIPFSLLQRERAELANLEAILLGMAGLLPDKSEDMYIIDLSNRWNYLTEKYRISQNAFLNIQFYRLRPDNFPTIRLVQLAKLYHQTPNLFSRIMEVKTAEALYDVFSCATSVYWESHYLPDRESKKKKKTLSKNFIDLLIVNVIAPLRFVYFSHLGHDVSEDISTVFYSLPPEKNTIIDNFKGRGLPADNALAGQALIQLKKGYCEKGKCLSCSIGLQLLR